MANKPSTLDEIAEVLSRHPDIDNRDYIGLVDTIGYRIQEGRKRRREGLRLVTGEGETVTD